MKMTQLTKKKKGWLSAEVVIVMVVVMLLLVGAIIAYPHMKDSANRTTAQQEMQTIKAATQVYMGYARNSQPPASLAALVAGLKPEDAIDRAEHLNLIDKPEWKNNAAAMLDPWGNQYDYSAGDRTITSTAGGGTATPITISF